MYILLTIFENTAPICGILHSHYATMLRPLTTGGELLWEKLFSPTKVETIYEVL